MHVHDRPIQLQDNSIGWCRNAGHAYVEIHPTVALRQEETMSWK
jgi:hypothetical protein